MNQVSSGKFLCKFLLSSPFSVTLHLFANRQATLVSILDVYKNEKELWVTFFGANTTELKCPVEYSFLK